MFWGLFDSASRRLLRLDALYTAHALAGVPDFDNPGKFTSQGVAMVANALSHAGIRDGTQFACFVRTKVQTLTPEELAEPLLDMLSRVVLQQLSPREYTAQTVALIAAAFERLSYTNRELFARVAQVALAIPGTHFTCCTSTNVQILTPVEPPLQRAVSTGRLCRICCGHCRAPAFCLAMRSSCARLRRSWRKCR